MSETGPNVRIHLRGGQTIETRCRNVATSRGGAGNDLTTLRLEGIVVGWPGTAYMRLDSVDAIEWLGDLDEGEVTR